jgi:invasion protein IalB
MPWVKVCDGQGTAPGNSVVCFTVKEAYLTTGQFFGSVAVIAATSSSKPKLRTVLPLGVDLARGTRMILDDSQPVSGSFSVCFSNGCLAEYQVTPDQQRKLETGKSLAVEAVDGAKRQRIYAVFPLDDFLSAANSPISPEELQKRQNQFSDELKARSQGEKANPR